ncbi:MAG: BamA/TamA family outer membrane protein, partial [Deltaproteobacteria bacterium]|nr:BamA/TamA family outer membrane protein [Deltaproteobacteria bacterium]
EIAGPRGTDAELLLGGRIVTPRLPFGRFVVDGFSLDRYRNYLNPLQSLGGTTRLRGYRAAAFVGPSALVTNVELRTPPVQVFSILAGLAAFYDAGDAFRRREEMVLRQGVGLGLRILVPQIERVVFRVDLATPLDRSDPAGETTVVAQFRQAFPDPGPVPPALAP